MLKGVRRCCLPPSSLPCASPLPLLLLPLRTPLRHRSGSDHTAAVSAPSPDARVPSYMAALQQRSKDFGETGSPYPVTTAARRRWADDEADEVRERAKSPHYARLITEYQRDLARRRQAATATTRPCRPILTVGGAEPPTSLLWVLERHLRPTHATGDTDRVRGSGGADWRWMRQQPLPMVYLHGGIARLLSTTPAAHTTARQDATPANQRVAEKDNAKQQKPRSRSSRRRRGDSTAGGPPAQHAAAEAESAGYVEVSEAFAQRFRRATTTEQERMWAELQAARAAQVQQKMKKSNAKASRRSVAATATATRQTRPLFYWRVSEGSARQSQDGKAAPAQPEPVHEVDADDHSAAAAPLPLYATLVRMLPSLTGSMSGDDTNGDLEEGSMGDDSTAASTEEEEEVALSAASPYWIPAALLHYLPYFPLPSSLALTVLSSSPGTSGATAGSGFNHGQSADTWRGDGFPPNNTAVFSSYAGGEDGSMIAAWSDSSLLHGIPERALSAMRRRWATFWSSREDPTAFLQKPYFFPVEAFPFLDHTARDRLRCSSPSFFRHKLMHLPVDEQHKTHLQYLQQTVASRDGGGGGGNGSLSRAGSYPVGAASLPLPQSQPSPVAMATSAAMRMNGAGVSWQHTVRCAGQLHLNADAIPLIAAMVDTQFCTRHAIPLDECGNVFFAAIPFVRQEMQRNLRPEGRLLRVIGATFSKQQCGSGFGDDNRSGDWTEDGAAVTVADSLVDDDIDTSERNLGYGLSPQDGTQKTPLYMDLKRAQQLVERVRQEQPPHHHPSGGSAQPWVDRVRAESSDAAKKGLSLSGIRGAQAGALKGFLNACGFVWSSPYWVDVATMEERWGLTPLPMARAISVGGRLYVNAEQTLDASRFTARTCAPKRIHQVLCREGLVHCSWRESARLRGILARQLQTPGQKNGWNSSFGATATDNAQYPSTQSGLGAFPPRSSTSPDAATRQTKTHADLLLEAEEMRQTTNLWISTDVVALAQWTVIPETARMVRIPRSQVFPTATEAMSVAGDAAIVTTALDAAEKAAECARTEGEDAALTAEADYIICVCAEDIADAHREELVHVLSYAPQVCYDKVDTTLTPGDAGYAEWHYAQQLADEEAQQQQQAANTPTEDPTTSGAHLPPLPSASSPSPSPVGSFSIQSQADLLRREAVAQKIARRRRRSCKITMASRFELAFASLAMQRSGVQRSEEVVCSSEQAPVPPPAAHREGEGEKDDRDLWVSLELLEREPALRLRSAANSSHEEPSGGRSEQRTTASAATTDPSAVASSPISVYEVELLYPRRDSLGLSMVRQHPLVDDNNNSSSSSSTLALIHHTDIQWPDGLKSVNLNSQDSDFWLRSSL